MYRGRKDKCKALLKQINTFNYRIGKNDKPEFHIAFIEIQTNKDKLYEQLEAYRKDLIQHIDQQFSK